jgi:hypothetical protein
MRKSVMIGATAVSTDCRFPPPWSVKEQDGCFAVQDNNGKVYFADEPGRRLFTRDEARYLAANVAKLPELLREAGITAPRPSTGALTASFLFGPAPDCCFAALDPMWGTPIFLRLRGLWVRRQCGGWRP